jgi:hypothetical protein
MLQKIGIVRQTEFGKRSDFCIASRIANAHVIMHFLFFLPDLCKKASEPM